MANFFDVLFGDALKPPPSAPQESYNERNAIDAPTSFMKPAPVPVKPVAPIRPAPNYAHSYAARQGANQNASIAVAKAAHAGTLPDEVNQP